MNPCPFCAEQIPDTAVVCQYCGSDLTESPQTEPPRRDIGDDAGMRMLMPVGRSGWAIAAGYLGLISVICLPAPIALIVSIVAIMHLKKNPKLHGMGRAIFGLVMGVIFSVILVIGVIANLAN